jgi:polyhydroxyalkanoate synthesis repressor PhaR
MAEQSTHHQIKRYRNRKLYDTTTSTYVSLEDLGELLAAGQDIVVVEQVGGKDITGHTLALVLARREDREVVPSVTEDLAAILKKLPSLGR